MRSEKRPTTRRDVAIQEMTENNQSSNTSCGLNFEVRMSGARACAYVVCGMCDRGQP